MKKIACILLSTTLLFACNDNEDKTTSEDETVMKASPIEVSDVEISPDFPEAKLTIGDISTQPAGGDSVKVTFNFKVANYELKTQTSDADTKMCANSDKGQHIHFIMDNQPYVALYEPKHETTLTRNSEHYLLAFLSRSYHESIKSNGAAVLYHFKIDDKGNVQKLDAPTTPMVFYSRPKGDYLGEKEIRNLLFDFYIWNTGLGVSNHKVMAQIRGDGVDTTLEITEWEAKFLHNMPLGKPSIKLTLVDYEGKRIDGPMTEVTREFNLAMDEPIQ